MYKVVQNNSFVGNNENEKYVTNTSWMYSDIAILYIDLFISVLSYCEIFIMIRFLS